MEGQIVFKKNSDGEYKEYIKDSLCLNCAQNKTFCQYCKRNYNDYYCKESKNVNSK